MSEAQLEANRLSVAVRAMVRDPRVSVEAIAIAARRAVMAEQVARA